MWCRLFDWLWKIIPFAFKFKLLTVCGSSYGIFSGSGLLSSPTVMNWKLRSAMLLGGRFNFRPESKLGKTESSTPPTLFSTTKNVYNTGNTSSSYSSSFSSNKSSSILQLVKFTHRLVAWNSKPSKYSCKIC